MTFTINGKQVLAALDRYLEESRQAKKPVIHQETIETIHEQLDLAAIFLTPNSVLPLTMGQGC